MFKGILNFEYNLKVSIPLLTWQNISTLVPDNMRLSQKVMLKKLEAPVSLDIYLARCMIQSKPWLSQHLLLSHRKQYLLFLPYWWHSESTRSNLITCLILYSCYGISSITRSSRWGSNLVDFYNGNLEPKSSNLTIEVARNPSWEG